MCLKQAGTWFAFHIYAGKKQMCQTVSVISQVHLLGSPPPLFPNWGPFIWVIHFPVSHLNLITLYQLLHFCLAEEHELLVLNHLREMLLGKELSSLHQVQAVVSFGKVADTQTVGGIELTLQEITARSFHPWGNKRCVCACTRVTYKIPLSFFLTSTTTLALLNSRQVSGEASTYLWAATNTQQEEVLEHFLLWPKLSLCRQNPAKSPLLQLWDPECRQMIFPFLQAEGT